MNVSNTLNFLRWISAFMVVIGHLKLFLFVNRSELYDKSLFSEIFYFFTGFGHQAVMIFFFVSGYLVGGGDASKVYEK